MSYLRTQFSAVVVWGMIPLAVWAGAPSSGCLCASGQFKLFCAHDHHAPHLDASHDSGCCAVGQASDAHCQQCAVDLEQRHGEHEGDCCQHGSESPGDGVRARSCCQPVLNALSMVSAPVSAPDHDAPAVAVEVAEPPAIACLARFVEAVDFDTGPPQDRIIAFGHLLL